MGRKKKELVSETNQPNDMQLDKMVLRSEEPTQEESSVYDPEAFRKSIKSLRGKKRLF